MASSPTRVRTRTRVFPTLLFRPLGNYGLPAPSLAMLQRGPMGFIGPIKMTLTNQYVEDRRPFFFNRRSHQNQEKTVAFCLKDLFFIFFGDHIKIRRKLWHFSLLFWSTQNWRCSIFELNPGPRLALSSPDAAAHIGEAPLNQGRPSLKP